MQRLLGGVALVALRMRLSDGVLDEGDLLQLDLILIFGHCDLESFCGKYYNLIRLGLKTQTFESEAS